MPIKIFRSYHQSDQLNDIFEELLSWCDILWIEMAEKEGYKLTKEHLNSLSFSGHSFTSSNRGTLWQKLESLIMNSRKIIEPEKSPIPREEIQKNEDSFDKSLWFFRHGEFNKGNETMIKQIDHLVEINEKRGENIPLQLKKIQENNFDKKILAMIGAGHFLGYQLKQLGISAKEEFPFKPYIFNIADELIKKIQLGMEYDNILFSRIFVENDIANYLHYSEKSTKETILTSRNISEKISWFDIKSLSTYLGERIYSVTDPIYDPAYLTIIWLKKRGFNI